MIKYKYRFKNEKEFLSEFGEGWRTIHSVTFITSMDYLLGTEIDEKTHKFSLKEYRLPLYFHFNIKNNTGGYFGIEYYMIKQVKIGVDYNEKRVLVYD